MKSILAISGSIRKNSSNEFILQAIKDRYSEMFSVHFFDALDSLPHFNPDPDIDPIPAPVAAFREAVVSADGIIICSPEYVFSLPAVLKNALEWCVATTIFTRKPVVGFIASGLGEKACNQLTLILETLQCNMDNNSIIVLQGARGKINNYGKITDDKMLKDIDKVIETFILLLDQKSAISL